MAGMFYSLQEAAAKLNKTEQEVKDLVREGRLREFRDGPNLLFKVDEVESLMSDTSIMASAEPSAGTEQAAEDEISLVPEPEGRAAASERTDEGTAMGDEGANIPGETDSEYQVADDSLGETKAEMGETPRADDMLGETKAASDEASLEEIEEDINLDTFGSGSGLLDLSLQADDTSLGGILDEIYTSEVEGGQETGESSAMEVAAEAEQLIPDEGLAEPQPILERPSMVQAYVEPEPDKLSNAFGIMLFLPLLVIVYTAIVVVAGFNNVMPAILTSIQSLIWYVMVGVAVAAGLIVGVAFMLSASAAKTEKKPKARKAKKAKKEKKPKKDKKAKS